MARSDVVPSKREEASKSGIDQARRAISKSDPMLLSTEWALQMRSWISIVNPLEREDKTMRGHPHRGVPEVCTATLDARSGPAFCDMTISDQGDMR
ncbi:hypothetical protein W911_01325 [Hyphomicrobium nitrativorans NL23]|uniref:Uncharacterized protein n=1 Tax=Hyphomicrobium nitrativorans NL23 TaxID=1029756 RepID=V5SH67_9HYPH|nr:hypothetical protein [Hyphomicrobium nitrativorans]AHB49827.1 hypothetical protein W911_01325 [Hyphomicrobium nitrativorans NL23]